MRQSRQSIGHQIRDSRNKQDKPNYINYQRLIIKQQEVINSLQDELLMLKSYISLEKASLQTQTFCSDFSFNNTSTSSIEAPPNKDLDESIQNTIKNYDQLFRQILEILDMKLHTTADDPNVVDEIKKLKDISTTKQEPIFVERIKEIKVPITVQKIIEKPVQRIIEKIVYVERHIPESKIVEKPIQFKEKTFQKYGNRKQQNINEIQTTLNKTYSQKNLRNKKPQRSYNDYDDDRYGVNKNINSNHDFYRKDTQPTLIKKRQANKFYGYKKDNNY